MQDNDMSGELPDDIAAMMEDLFSSMKRASLDATAAGAAEPQELPVAPLELLPAPDQDEPLMRPEVMAAMLADERYADDFQRLREQAEYGFTALLNEAHQYLPVAATGAVAGNMKMGTAMEVRDLMAASRRNLAGSGSNHDERRLMAQYLAVAGLHNFNRLGWDPAVSDSYANEGGNLLSALLSPPAA